MDLSLSLSLSLSLCGGMVVDCLLMKKMITGRIWQIVPSPDLLLLLFCPKRVLFCYVFLPAAFTKVDPFNLLEAAAQGTVIGTVVGR